MIVLNLTPDQVGQASIVLSTPQLAAIHQQEASGSQPPVVTNPPAGNGGARTYPIAQLRDDDKRWLRIAQDRYRQDLRMLPGAHQLLLDMLTDTRGRTIAQGGQVDIASLTNQIMAGGTLYDDHYGVAQAALYNGTLRQVYANLVTFMLTGK